VGDTDVNGDLHATSGIRPGIIAGGGIILALGATMLLSTSGAVDVPVGRLIGPAVLITLGVLTLTQKGGLVCGYRPRAADGRRRPHRARGGASGVWLIGLGAWMLISQMHLWGFTFATSWPLVIILSGIMMLIRGIR